MHFCGPDQLHGFEERLTTDIYPADFGWTPDWDQPERPPALVPRHVVGASTPAPCVRTNQLDFDDEVGFAAERALFDHVRSADARPFCFVGLVHPSARPVRHPPASTGTSTADEDIPMPAHGYDESIAHPHELRLRHVCAMDDVADHRRRRFATARRAYYGAISYVDDQFGRLIDVLRETGGSTTPSSSSPATTATCWASAGSGTR